MLPVEDTISTSVHIFRLHLWYILTQLSSLFLWYILKKQKTWWYSDSAMKTDMLDIIIS